MQSADKKQRNMEFGAGARDAAARSFKHNWPVHILSCFAVLQSGRSARCRLDPRSQLTHCGAEHN